MSRSSSSLVWSKRYLLSESYFLSLLRAYQEWSRLLSATSRVCVSWYVSATVLLYALLYLSTQRRHSGWIHTLLEEAENERMHLMHVAPLIVFVFSDTCPQDLLRTAGPWHRPSRTRSRSARRILQHILYAIPLPHLF
jgi:hypothetical protein